MKENFDKALSLVLVHEGGWSNHPADPGGATMKGVIQRVYDAYRKSKGYNTQSVRNISDSELKEIYKERYWDLIRGDELPSGLDYCVFDGAVNSGPGQSIKWLQRAVGVIADGKFGPLTLGRVKVLKAEDIIKAYTEHRFAMLRSLKTWPTFGKGWTIRVNAVQRDALLMIGASQPEEPEVPEPTAVRPNKRYNVILFRGLWGSVWSTGLDVLAEALRKLENVDYVIVLPYTAEDKAITMLNQFQDETILVGHSFGVGAAISVAKQVNEDIPLLVSFDPSQYWFKGHKLSSNIKRCINFWQDAPLFAIGNQKIVGAENIHIDTTHVDIEDRSDLHKIILDEIRKL